MVVAGPALLGIVGLGAVGGILANIALTPLTAGASLLQSYWYGSGLILGERMMYTVHWEQIKGRLDKGEDFLTVLDKIMNDDITAIANLSFKAMDVTGKLYIDKAGVGLAAFVEKLLAAMLTANPLGLLPDGSTEPPPTGTETPTGISYTVAELEAFNLAQLQSILDNASDYTDSTVQNAQTIKAKKLIEIQQEQEQQENLETFTTNLQQAETAFLQVLTTVTLLTLYTSYIPAFSSTEQGAIVAKLREKALFGVVSTRFASAGSAQNLREYQATLATIRENFRITKQQLSSGSTSTVKINALKTLQLQINVMHVLIWTHQLVYSR